MPMSTPLHTTIETMNGRVQVSRANAESDQLGIIVERDGLFGGALLSLPQADQLARLLLRRDGLHQSADRSGASREWLQEAARRVLHPKP